MGNAIKSSSAVSKSDSQVNLDDIDLSQLDETKSNNKENKKTRKSKEYKQLRAMARSGIDTDRRFQLWSKATNAINEYCTMYDDITKELFQDINMNEFPQFPTFGSNCKFSRLLSNDSSQRILLVLAIEHDSLKYCPQLPYIVELMLLDKHSTEHAVFAICHSMLIASKRNNWYFRTDYFNSYVRVKTFLSIFEDNVSFVASYLKHENMDISNILGDAISSMFVQYLNDETYLRLIDTFTVEGYKVLFRVGVALLNHAQSQLVKYNDLVSFNNALIKESKKLTPNELCQRCFKIYLTRNKFEKLDKFHRKKGFDDKLLDKIEEETYVRRWPSWNTNIMNKSKILTRKVQFMQLWVWLPPGCHIGDYQMLFSTHNDGYKLSELYLKCQQQQHLIIVIKTTKGDVIGGYVCQLDDPDAMDKFAPLRKRIKDPKIFLFQLHSMKEDDEHKENDNDTFVPKCFWTNTADHFYHQSRFQLKNMHILNDEIKSNTDDNGINNIQKIPIVFPSKDSLIIGDGEVNCIYLDSELNHGFSSKCVTFNSPSLVNDKDGEFQVSNVEIWCVQ